MADQNLVIITGGAGGIGVETARLLGRRGQHALLADLDVQAAHAAADALRAEGLAATACGVDVADPASVAAMVAQARAIGRIAALVNAAGVESPLAFLDISLAEYERVMRVNTTSVWICCQAVIPVMRDAGRGAIVNVSSVAGQRGGGLLGTSAYSTSKGAVIAMTKALAREFARDGIRVNAVSPALTMTALAQRQLDRAPAGTLQKIEALTPMGRAARPSEIAAVIAFLASEEASYVTGHVYNVDGGSAM